MSTRTMAIAVAAAVQAACTTDEPARSNLNGQRHEQVVETRGDTTVVRTLSGSVWGAEANLVAEFAIGELDGPDEYLFGSIGSFAVDDDRNVYVLDTQAQHVQVFDSAGTYVRTLGGRGEGPGELSFATSVATLPDGRVVVNEAAALRIQVYGPGLHETQQWRYTAAGVPTPPRPVEVDRHGRTFVGTVEIDPSGRIDLPLVAIGPDGTQQGTHLPPGFDFEPPSLELQSTLGTFTSKVLIPIPLTPSHHWALHPNGHFVTGISSDYQIDLGLDTGVLRMERAFVPVAVSPEERSYHRDDVTRSMRVTQPDWRWNGPPIPSTRPPFRGLAAGRDGRIWVTVSTEARPVESEFHDPQNPNSDPILWRSPLRYDVFEPDGTYLGTVVPPEGFSGARRPVFDGDHVWAVAQDELGVERVVRYRIVVGAG